MLVDQVSLAWRAAYRVLSCGLAFYAAIDVLRRATTAHSAILRRCVVAGCLFCFYWGEIVAGLLAWLAWRKAILNVELEPWRKKDSTAKPNAPTEPSTSQ
jgi:hypothetical protein